jgi:hypothetical protein
MPRIVNWNGVPQPVHDPEDRTRFDDRFQPRATFTGDMTKAKMLATMTPAELAAAGLDPQGSPLVNDATPRSITAPSVAEAPPGVVTAPEAHQPITAPPEGLLADIAAALARTKVR